MPSTASLTPAASILSTERIVATTAAGATVSVLASGLPVSNAQAAADAVVLASAATDATTKANAAQAAAIAASAQRASNLSDLASASTARTNLGLGNVDNTSDEAKPLGAVQKAALNLITGISPASSASANTSAINSALTAALNAGGGTLGIIAPGTYSINAPLVIGSNTTLTLADGVVISLAASSNCHMIENSAVTAQRTVTDAAITIGTTALSSATAAFTSGDVGRTVSIAGAGGGTGGLGPLTAEITAIVSGTQATISVAAHKTVSGASCPIYNRDRNIRVIGGKWDRGTNSGSGANAHSAYFRHVDGLEFEANEFVSTGGKYCVSLGSVTNFRCGVGLFDGASDGIHVTGPATRGVITRAAGATDDDMVAFTCGDYSMYADVAGDITNITVRSLYPNGAKQALKILAGAGWLADNIIVEGTVAGTCYNNGVWVGDDTGNPETTGGSYGKIDLGSIKVITGGSSYYPLVLPAPAARHIRVAITQQAGPATASISLQSTSTAQIDHLDVHSSVWTAALLSTVISPISSGITIERLTVENCVQTVGSLMALGGATVTKLSVVGHRASVPASTYLVLLSSGTLSNVDLINCVLTSSSSTRYIHQIGGTLTNVTVSGGSISGGNNLVTPTAGVDLTLTGVKLSSLSRIIGDVRGASVVRLNNPAMASIGLAAFYVNTGGSLTMHGQITTSGTFALIDRAASETVSVYGLTLPVDFSKVTKTASTMATNTNAALSCGVGPAICDGTNWKNIFSGSTY